MKALIIGGNGFIGTNLADVLLERGHQVTSFDRYPGRYRDASPQIDYVFGDFANHGDVHEVVKGHDYVFHLAYTTLPQSSNDDPIFDVRSNVVDTLQLLEACKEHEVKKIVFISSGGTVYGVPQILPIPESHPTEPICSYGITKLTIEKYLHLYRHLRGLDYVIARLSNPYGELQNPQAKQGAVAVFLGMILKDEPITIFGDGQVVRDYVYIRDAALALAKSAEYRPEADQPRVFNVGSGRGYSLNEVVDAIKAVVNKKVVVNYIPARSVDVPANVLDIKSAENCLSWKPEMDLKEGLSRTWQWLLTINKN